MQNYILFSDVDQIIIDRSGNQQPDISKRVRAINNEIDSLQISYDLLDGVRDIEVSIITDGRTAYNLSELVADNDVKTIKDFYFGGDKDAQSRQFVELKYEDFVRKYNAGGAGNYFTKYTNNGIDYLRILTNEPSTTPQTLTMSYYTIFKALDQGGDFIPAVVNAAGVKILLQARFKELVGIGALLRVFYGAIGEDSMAYFNELKKEYKDLKDTLGLKLAVKAKTPTDRVKIRPIW